MGLASALAAQAAHAAPQQPYPGAGAAYPPQQAGWGYQQAMPQNQQQAAYPGLAAQPQMQQSSSNQGMASVVAAKLNKIVAANKLQTFYPPDRLQGIVQRTVATVDFHGLAARWRMPVELAIDLASLALYDIVIYGDDSGSMETGDGERIEDLKLIMGKVAEVATMFDEDGIEVRFINSAVQGRNIRQASDASRLLSGLEYRWDTKLATQMEAKILQPMAYSRRLSKPLLIITITDGGFRQQVAHTSFETRSIVRTFADGEPSDKPMDKIVTTIQEARARLTPQYGPHAVAFQFAQVGKDREAQEFLSRLDKHPVVGKMIDCTSYYELESAEYAAKGLRLSVEAWLVKLMVGAIDPEYDEQDETAGQAGGAAGYGQPAVPGYGSTSPYPPPYGQGQGMGAYPQAPAAGGYPPLQQQQQAAAGAYPPPVQHVPSAAGYPYQQQQQQLGAQPLPAGYPQQQQQPLPFGHQQGYHQQQQHTKPPSKLGLLGKLFGA